MMYAFLLKLLENMPEKYRSKVVHELQSCPQLSDECFQNPEQDLATMVKLAVYFARETLGSWLFKVFITTTDDEIFGNALLALAKLHYPIAFRNAMRYAKMCMEWYFRRKIYAIKALAEFPSPITVSYLLNLLPYSSSEIAECVLTSLFCCKDILKQYREGVQKLLNFLRNAGNSVISQYIQSSIFDLLREIPIPAEDILSVLEHTESKFAVAHMLLLLHENAYPQCVQTALEYIDTDNEGVLRAVYTIIDAHAPQSIPLLLTVDITDEKILHNFLYILFLLFVGGKIPQKFHPQIAGILLKFANTSNLFLKAELANVMQYIPDPRIKRTLLEMAVHENENVRAAAVAALQNFPEEDVVAMLISRLQDSSRSVVEFALMSLCKIAHPAAIPYCLQFIKNGEFLYAMDEFYRFGESAAILPLLSHPSPVVRGFAVRTLAHFQNREILESLTNHLLTETEPSVIYHAVSVLSQTSPSVLYPLLTGRPEIAREIIRQLAKTQDTNLLPYLYRYLRDGNTAVLDAVWESFYYFPAEAEKLLKILSRKNAKNVLPAVYFALDRTVSDAKTDLPVSYVVLYTILEWHINAFYKGSPEPAVSEIKESLRQVKEISPNLLPPEVLSLV